jgi:hypothetical protein
LATLNGSWSARVTAIIETDIPARLDRLPFSRFHVLVVLALGITWVLDGLEVTIVGAIGPIVQDSRTLGPTAQDIGNVAAFHVAGAVVGARFYRGPTGLNPTLGGHAMLFAKSK